MADAISSSFKRRISPLFIGRDPAMPFALISLLALGLLGSSDSSAEQTVLHFELDRSSPAADSTVAQPAEVRLWFTQAPQAGTTQIRVTEGTRRIPTGDVEVDSKDATSFYVVADVPLSPGSYRVVWRSMAPDGHVVDGEFGFVVASNHHVREH
jgi:methionine-rich copper-binding protein CopC